MPKRSNGPVPRVPGAVEAAIHDWLTTHRGPSRRRSVAAPLLAIVCMLHEQGRPIPLRWQLANRLHCSIDAIDVALNTAIARGEITEAIRPEAGRVMQRISVSRQRYMTPCQGLLAAYRAAR